jgi:hypothetical protein
MASFSSETKSEVEGAHEPEVRLNKKAKVFVVSSDYDTSANDDQNSNNKPKGIFTFRFSR